MCGRKYCRALLVNSFRVSFMDSEDSEQIEKQKLEALDLEALSIQALIEYVKDLKIEIQRVETVIKFKKKARRGAEDFFR
jgi:uncharacterized small protein (DUF1192 family)